MQVYFYLNKKTTPPPPTITIDIKLLKLISQVLQWVEDFQLYMEAGASNKLNSQVACNFFKEVVTRLGLDYVEQDGQK